MKKQKSVKYLLKYIKKRNKNIIGQQHFRSMLATTVIYYFLYMYSKTLYSIQIILIILLNKNNIILYRYYHIIRCIMCLTIKLKMR